MKPDDILMAVLDALNDTGIPYMLTGSLAYNMYGIPRLSMDADLVLQASSEDIGRLIRHLPSGFRLDPQMSFESVTGTMRHILEYEDARYKVELFFLSEEEYDQTRFARRQQVVFSDRKAFAPTPEDVLLGKLIWAERARRRKDLEDIRNLLNAYGPKFDWPYVYSWCDRKKVRRLLDSIRSE